MSTFIRVRIDHETEEKLHEIYERFGCTAETFAETAVAVAARRFPGKYPAHEPARPPIVEEGVHEW